MLFSMKDDDYDPIQFYSTRLASSFRRRASADRIRNMPVNDSFLSISSQPEKIEIFIHRIFFSGISPWENENTPPHLFYLIPFDSKLFDPVSQFCFPHGAKFMKQKINSSAELINQCLTQPIIDDIEFFTLYFPSIIDYPYFYCCRFMGNQFTMPTISHDLGIEEIFSLIENKEIPTSQMCICIQTNSKEQMLYYKFIMWMLECEKIGKYSISPILDSFYLKIQNDQEFNLMDFEQYKCLWPQKHREAFSALLAENLFSFIPNKGESIIIDKPPFPRFEWTRISLYPDEDNDDLTLSLPSLKQVLSNFSPQHLDIFISLINSLLLEDIIVIYSKNIQLVTSAILLCHFLIKPLKWVNPSISLLPDSAVDIFESPLSYIVGIDKIIPQIKNDDVVFFNLDEKDPKNCVKINKKKNIISFPSVFNLFDQLKVFFTKDNLNNLKTKNDNYDIEKSVLNITNNFVKELLNPLRASIITDYTNPKHAESRFLPELFLKHFDPESRVFVNRFINTQMMQFHIELECKTCSCEFNNQINN